MINYQELEAFLEDFLRMPATMENFTPEAATDELGLLIEVRKAVEKKERFLKEWIKHQLFLEQSEDFAPPNSNSNVIEGEQYTATLETYTQERISTPAVRELLDPEVIRAVTKTIEITKLTTTRRASSSSSSSSSSSKK